MVTGRSITYEMGLRFELSLQVAIMATLVAVIISIPLGTLSAVYQNTWIDYCVRTFSIAGMTAERTMRASPVRFSVRTGFFLCGIAEEPF